MKTRSAFQVIVYILCPELKQSIYLHSYLSLDTKWNEEWLCSSDPMSKFLKDQESKQHHRIDLPYIIETYLKE